MSDTRIAETLAMRFFNKQPTEEELKELYGQIAALENELAAANEAREKAVRELTAAKKEEETYFYERDVARASLAWSTAAHKKTQELLKYAELAIASERQRAEAAERELTAANEAQPDAEEVREAMELLKFAACPCCDGEGAIQVGSDASDIEQCQWCYEREALFAKLKGESRE